MKKNKRSKSWIINQHRDQYFKKSKILGYRSRSAFKLIEINKKGATIHSTNHYLEEAERLCKNISIIDHGKIVRNSDMNSFLREIEIETFVFDLKEKTSKILSSENFDIKKIDDATFSVQANKGTNLNSIFDFFDQEGIEILSMRTKPIDLKNYF